MSAMCVGGVQAVEFFESLRDRISEDEKELYEKALNRIRYEAAKGIGAKRRTIKAIKAWHSDQKVCGKCGFGAGEPNAHYCPNCGTAYLDNPYTIKCLEEKGISTEEWMAERTA